MSVAPAATERSRFPDAGPALFPGDNLAGIPRDGRADYKWSGYWSLLHEQQSPAKLEFRLALKLEFWLQNLWY